MAAGTREVVDELLARLAAGDPGRVAALYGERVDWRLDWPAEELGGAVPWIRERSTRAGVAEHFRLIAEAHRPEEAGTTVHRVLVDGDDAVVLGTIRNTVRHTGARYVAHVALHLTVEDGLVVRHHVHEDSLSVWRAWSAPAQLLHG